MHLNQENFLLPLPSYTLSHWPNELLPLTKTPQKTKTRCVLGMARHMAIPTLGTVHCQRKVQVYAYASMYLSFQAWISVFTKVPLGHLLTQYLRLETPLVEV